MQKRIVANVIISELKKSNACLYVKGVLFNLKTNLNGVRVTEAFMDEIVENKEKYLGIPLCADVKGLINGKVIGHMYDEKKDEFKSQIIGSMIDFEKQETEDGAALVITAKIMKRYRAVCEAVGGLFASGDLKFSFELLAGEYTEEEDGTMLIDVSENNYLEGAAVVTFPACEEAVAMQLVAECLNQGDENMTNEEVQVNAEEEKVVETAEEETKVNAEAETEVKAETEVTAEEEKPAGEVNAATEVKEATEVNEATEVETETEVKSETEAKEGSCKDKEDEEEEKKKTASTGVENAEVYTTTTHTEVDQERSYDSETGEETYHEVVDTTTVYSELKEAVTNMLAEIKAIKEQLAEIQKPEEKHTIAEAAHTEYDLLNPFIDDIASPQKYTLLASEETPSHYGLLDPVD